MGILRELVAVFDTKANTEPLKKTDSLMDKIKGRFPGLVSGLGVLGINIDIAVKAFEALGVAAASVFAVFRAFRFAQEFSEQARSLQTVANRLSITTDQLQTLGEWGRAAGADVDTMNVALSIFSEHIGEAATGTGAGAEAFSKLHVRIKNADGSIRGMYEVLGDVTDRIQAAHSRAQQMTIAMSLFGRQGRVLVDVLSHGSAALREAEEEFRNLGGGMSEASIIAGVTFSNSMHRLNTVMDSVRASIATSLLPVLSGFIDKMVLLAAWFARTTIAANFTKIAMVAAFLGMAYSAVRAYRAISSMSAAMKLLTLRSALYIVGIGFLVLLLDDLIGLWQGNDSEIGHFIDSMTEAGTAASWVKELKDDVHALAEDMRLAAEYWDHLFNGPVSIGHSGENQFGGIAAINATRDNSSTNASGVTTTHLHRDNRGRVISSAEAPTDTPTASAWQQYYLNNREVAQGRQAAMAIDRHGYTDEAGKHWQGSREHTVRLPNSHLTVADHAAKARQNAAQHPTDHASLTPDEAWSQVNGSHGRTPLVIQTPVNVHFHGSVTDPRAVEASARRGTQAAVIEANLRQVRQLESSGLVSQTEPSATFDPSNPFGQ